MTQQSWPYTDAVDPSIYNHRTDWPKISIVTPSYNQGQYIEETILSILKQNYPNLEYIIIDGGSTDETVAIIKKYKAGITYWVSEKDNGQSHAINKGLAKCTGEIFNWINSDDYLTKEALLEIGKDWDSSINIFAGSVRNFSESTELVLPNQNLTFENLLSWQNKCCFQQPGLWAKLDLFTSVGAVSEELDYCFDYEHYLKILAQKNSKIIYSNKIVANFRLHNTSKTESQSIKFDAEQLMIWGEYLGKIEYPITLFKVISIATDRKYWHLYLDKVYTSKEHKIKKIYLILKAILVNPYQRLSRFTLGMVKKIIYDR